VLGGKAGTVQRVPKNSVGIFVNVNNCPTTCDYIQFIIFL